MRRPEPRLGLAALAGAGLLAGAVPAVAGSAPADAVATAAKKKRRPKPRAVKVRDNYYGPAKLKVRRNTKVTWKWPSDIGDTHDVKTRKVPRGAKKFQSPPYASGAKYSQTFKKPGTYKLYCTFHSTEMTMTVVVKK